MSKEICFLPATELSSLIRRRALSPVELVDAYLERISERNPIINAYVTVIGEQAREAAKADERAVGSGVALGPLHGLPVAIKDLFDYKAGVRNTFGCKPLANYVPTTTTTYVERIERAGAIVLGKTNAPEFGLKGATDNLLVGPTSTPFAVGKNSGGSSGGSAAAVADGMAALAQGTDGGGSIRIPASFCGVYGFKASFGRVAVATRPNGFVGHTPYIHSGPLTRTVDDAALLLSVMAGPHPRDPLSLPDDRVNFLAATRKSIKGLRIAYSPNLGDFPVDPRVTDVVREAVSAFEVAGASVEEVAVDLRHPQHELSALWVKQAGMLYADMVAAFLKEGIDLMGEHRAGLTSEFIEMVDAVRNMGAVEFKLDDWIRSDVFDSIADVLDIYDLLVTPTLAVPPFANFTNGMTAGPTEINGQAVNPLIGWCLTYPINYTGNPAASIPAGMTSDGLPIGMQIVGRRFADETVLAASAEFERIRPWFGTYNRL